MTSGSRNLIILGILSIIIALTTTSVSLAIYHNSGDIYLDRSRPNVLPDEDEINDDKDEYNVDYKLSENIPGLLVSISILLFSLSTLKF